jgi:hypothetical protein
MLTKGFDLAKAWDYVRHEVFQNKPAKAPYPQSIVKAREILLMMEVLLVEYESETSMQKKKMLADAFEYSVKQYRKLKSVNN